MRQSFHNQAIVIAFFSALASVLSAQDAHRDLLRGDRAYRQGNFSEAGEYYRNAARVQPGLQSWHNLGNSLYRQGNYAEAAEYYRKAADAALDATARAQAWHNLGNAQFQQGDMTAAVEAYKNALRHNPQDADTRHNLVLALKERQGTEGKEQRAESRGQRADGAERPPRRVNSPDDEGNRESRGQGAERKGQSAGGYQQRERQEGKGSGSAAGEAGTAQSDKQAGSEKPQPMNKSEAEQLLQIMEREEQKVQSRLRRAATAPPKSAKDW